MRRLSMVAVTLCLAFPLLAQEHPEHPKAAAPAAPAAPAVPEKKSEAAVAPGYSMDELEAAIQSTIESAQKKNGGWYRLKDKKSGKTWVMKLDHVHRERLSRLDAKTYFACTDFKTKDGTTVDVDFFMKDNGKKLVMKDAAIHKIDGKARYNWQEKDGFWVKVPVKG